MYLACVHAYIGSTRYREENMHRGASWTDCERNTIRIYPYVRRRCISQPPWSIFSGRYLHSWDSVGAKMSALEAPRRELSDDAPFGIGTLWIVKQSRLENNPMGV